MVGAGEKGGLLAEILARLATYLENAARLRRKVKSAMMYPMVVTIVAIGITIFPAGEGRAGVRRNLLRLRRQTARPDPISSSTISNICQDLDRARFCWAWAARSMAGSTSSRPSLAANSGIPAASSCPSSVTSPTKSAWRGSPARSPRSCAAACRSWKCMGIVSNTCGNVIMEKAIKSGCQRHRARRGHFLRPLQASHLPLDDHPHDDRRRTNRQN